MCFTYINIKACNSPTSTVANPATHQWNNTHTNDTPAFTHTHTNTYIMSTQSDVHIFVLKRCVPKVCLNDVGELEWRRL